MLKDNQEVLIQHLIRFHILDFQKCHREHGKRPGNTSVKQDVTGTEM